MKTMLKSYWNSYTPRGQFWLSLGLLMLAVDAALSFSYGITQTTLHGIGFALVAVMFALLPDAARDEWEHGRKVGGVVLGLLCIPIGGVAYYSHIGYGAGVRVGDMQRTLVQNNVHADTRDSVEQARRDVRSAEAAIERLSWLPSNVTAEGLRADIKNMEGNQVYRRSRQCSNVTIPESRAFCDRLAEQRKTLAAAESVEAEKARKAAALAWLEKAKEKAAGTRHVQSSVVNQNHVGAQLWLAVNGIDATKAINPDEVTTSYVNLMVAGAGALAFMLLAPIGLYMAGRNRRPEDDITPANDTMPGAQPPTVIVSRETIQPPHDNREIYRLLSKLDTRKAAA